MRFWAHSDRAYQRFTRLIVCGDGIPIVEYGAECRPSAPSEGFMLAHWTELSSAVTLAVPATNAYLRYRFEFQDTCSARRLVRTRCPLAARSCLLFQMVQQCQGACF